MTCEYCSKKFVLKNKYYKGRFCSHSCSGKYQYHSGINPVPTRSGSSPWNKGKSKKNDERLLKISEDRTGSRNWSWKGGVTTDSFRDTYKRQLREWREKVFIRDDWTCQRCSIRGGSLHPHHIIPLSLDRRFALDVSNGVTLCVTCHKEVHKFKERQFLNIEKLK